ncbi:glycosyltransferase [Loigolactobacillus rennini]|uniref:Poly(Glycerol-phosphate) alpha-glucosyltransferase n=1 Tax=Loigolactobacillus rennini DSM 20253 TaxID=1423796 RepID=A0A0R2DFH6_9LACO|nr:glycosyltransferase [Loigolactobacillus rennini]KRM98819.1 poly(glycerol-phosphate) alpha-glucosyltransferase [Loigolactobacillus rennini DSM 20253]
MFYFVNTSINPKKSGIEHAEMKRLALFSRHGVPAKIVTRFFSLHLHETLAAAGIAENNQINLFDFLQNSTGFKSVQRTIKDLTFPKAYRVVKVAEHYQIMVGKQLRMQVNPLSATDPRLNNVQYFAADGHLLKIDWYDTRGFKGLEQFYTSDGQVVSEQVFNPQGRVVYQTFHMQNKQGETKNTLYRWLNYRGHDWSFNGQEAMMRFFLDELNRVDNGQNVFIVDRTYELAWSTLRMRTPTFKVLHLHSNHVNDPSDPQHATLNYNYQLALNNLAQWNGVIAATPQQAQDFVARYGSSVPVFTIPVGVVPDKVRQAPRPKWSQRIPGKVVMVARLSEEKQQDQLIKAIKKVHQKLPNVTLDFWGYANGNTGTKLRQLVDKLQMSAYVRFMPYTQNVAHVYDQAQLAVLTSRAEGFALALLEGQAHGLPQVAYDIKYGPRAILHDHQDGLLVPVNNVDALANAIYDLLRQPKKLAAYSQHAYQNSEHYSEAAVWQAWQQLIDQVKHFYIGKAVKS